MAAARRIRRSRFPRRRRQTIRRRRKQTIRRRRKQTIRRRRVHRKLQQRKRSRFPRRRKQTTRRRIVRRKLQPRKRKQRVMKRLQGRKMGPQKNLPRKQGAKRTCDEFVSQVLRQLHRDKLPISTKAKGKMISFIRKFYKNVSDKAKSSKRVKRTSTIGTKELQNALKRMMHKNQALELAQTIQRASRH